jgi:hypothetical protein
MLAVLTTAVVVAVVEKTVPEQAQLGWVDILFMLAVAVAVVMTLVRFVVQAGLLFTAVKVGMAAITIMLSQHKTALSPEVGVVGLI